MGNCNPAGGITSPETTFESLKPLPAASLSCSECLPCQYRLFLCNFKVKSILPSVSLLGHGVYTQGNKKVRIQSSLSRGLMCSLRSMVTPAQPNYFTETTWLTADKLESTFNWWFGGNKSICIIKVLFFCYFYTLLSLITDLWSSGDISLPCLHRKTLTFASFQLYNPLYQPN